MFLSFTDYKDKKKRPNIKKIWQLAEKLLTLHSVSWTMPIKSSGSDAPKDDMSTA